MKLPQFFEKVGKDRYAMLTAPSGKHPLYVWDEEKQRIIPAYPLKRTSEQQSQAKI